MIEGERVRVSKLVMILMTAATAPLCAQAKHPSEPKVITAVSAAVDMPSYQGGPCPATLHFSGTIVADKTPTVPITYQWWRSDTTGQGPVRTITMTGKGVLVTDTWAVGKSGEMMRVWNELRILSPNAMKSERVNAAVLCR